MYVVIIDNPLAIFFINFDLDFMYRFSIFLHGVYNKYEINIPTKNGDITFKKFLNHIPIAVKLSSVLYTNKTAAAYKNQYNHFVNGRFFSPIFFLL